MPEPSHADGPADDNARLGATAVEFRRVARMNKHQLWSVCIAWCRDRTAAAAVLSRGLTEAWKVVKQTPEHIVSEGFPHPLRLTETIYRCVIDAASDSLAADRVRTEAAAGSPDDGLASLTAADISLYIMENYSALPRAVSCDLLNIPDDGNETLERVTKVLLREDPEVR